MLPIVKTKIIPTIGVLHWTAAKYIFERSNFTAVDKAILEEGIEWWSKKVDITDKERWEIKRIIHSLEADERGHWNRAKELLRQHNISYKTFYKMGLPFISDPNKCRTYGKG
jgi:hypothetical protein